MQMNSVQKSVIRTAWMIIAVFATSLISSGQVVSTGIEQLAESNFGILKGKRVGLVTNPTGVDRNLRSTVDILFNAPEVKLVALYGPEHGVRGEFTAGEYVASEKDPCDRPSRLQPLWKDP